MNLDIQKYLFINTLDHLDDSEPRGNSAAAEGSHDAGALQITLKPEPAETARCSITRKSANSCKLTVKECVREIRNSEFSALETIIRAKADASYDNRDRSAFNLNEDRLTISPPSLRPRTARG